MYANKVLVVSVAVLDGGAVVSADCIVDLVGAYRVWHREWELVNWTPAHRLAVSTFFSEDHEPGEIVNFLLDLSDSGSLKNKDVEILPDWLDIKDAVLHFAWIKRKYRTGRLIWVDMEGPEE